MGKLVDSEGFVYEIPICAINDPVSYVENQETESDQMLNLRIRC